MPFNDRVRKAIESIYLKEKKVRLKQVDFNSTPRLDARIGVSYTCGNKRCNATLMITKRSEQMVLDLHVFSIDGELTNERYSTVFLSFD